MGKGRFTFLRLFLWRPWPARTRARPGLRLFLHGRATYSFDVISVAPFADDLRAIADAEIWMGDRQHCIATLVCRDGTPLERNTVAVEIGGQMVGYCPSYLSTRYREWLEKWRFSGASVHCNAVIIGRRNQAGRLSAHGLKLDIELPFKATTMI